MKICTYCKSEIEDSCLQCPNCGAAEFVHKCPVCGNSYRGETCPECTMQAISEVVESVAALTGRMKDMIGEAETKGKVGVKGDVKAKGEAETKGDMEDSKAEAITGKTGHIKTVPKHPTRTHSTRTHSTRMQSAGTGTERRKESLFARIIRYILLGIFFNFLFLVIIAILVAVYIAITGNMPGFVIGLSS